MNKPTNKQSVELAAHLGDPDAMRAVGIETVDPEGFEAWAWDFSRFGQGTMARATLVAARIALPVWDDYQPSEDFEREILGGPLVGESVALVSRHVDIGILPGAEVTVTLDALITLVANASSYVEEASGDAERVGARRKAVSAGAAALAMLQVVAGKDGDALRVVRDPSEQVELRATLAAGPALQVVRCFAHACLATGFDAARLRAELRASLTQDLSRYPEQPGT